VNSPKSQNQTYMTLRMDDCTGKHSAKDLRTYAQQTTANIPVDRVEKLLLFVSSFFFFLLQKNEQD
jgi:hypothetical protein